MNGPGHARLQVGRDPLAIARAINQAEADADERAAVCPSRTTLDKYTPAIVEINRESRIKVQPGALAFHATFVGRKLDSSVPLTRQSQARVTWSR